MSEPCRILIIDDTPSDLEITKLQLRRSLLANPLEVCETGEAGLARLRDESREPIDVLLLDSSLPGISGQQTTAALRGDPRFEHLHIILLSALRPPWVDSCPPDEAPHAVLEKPVRLELLVKVLRRLGGYRLELIRDE